MFILKFHPKKKKHTKYKKNKYYLLHKTSLNIYVWNVHLDLSDKEIIYYNGGS